MAKIKDFTEQLICILNEYKDIAIKAHKEKLFSKYENYYNGTYDKKGTNDNGNNFNIIKLLVDTKSTFILDNNITTSVIAKTLNFANKQNIFDMQDMADVLEDAKNEVFEKNEIDSLNKKVVDRALKTNSGIVKVYWDQEEGEIGEIKITEINPANFFPDPNAIDIDDSNYIFIKKPTSIITLKKEYPEKAEEIDKLAKKEAKEKGGLGISSKYNGIITSTNDGGTTQIYVTDKEGVTGIKTQGQIIDIWECYIKDDTIFVEDDTDDKNDENIKKKARLKYPNGRYILYGGKDLKFEDKPIDFPFGYPFCVFHETPGDQILPSGGTVRDLIFIQDRLNKSYNRLIYLLGKYLSLIVIDVASGINKNDVLRKDILMLEPESLRNGLMPQILTNNTISEISSITQFIDSLKENAYELARVNPQMISGERPKGVTSGDMVMALNESAMTAIRQLQRDYMNFLINVTDKVLVLIQKYYTFERYVRISTSELIRFPLRERGVEEETLKQENIERIRIENKGNEKILEVSKTIKSDPNDYEFKTEIIAGSKLPKSRTQYAQLTMQLIQQGVFGNPNSLDTRKLILDTIDYPNRRAIIKDMEEKEALSADVPEIDQTLSLIEKMGFNFKDLEAFPDIQLNILKALGLEPQSPVIEPTQPLAI